MTRKTEIRKEIFKIMGTVYNFHPGLDETTKQAEFLDKVMDYLDAEISLRRKKQDKPKEEADDAQAV